jgi:hypothetical protein
VDFPTFGSPTIPAFMYFYFEVANIIILPSLFHDFCIYMYFLLYFHNKFNIFVDN